MPHRSAAAAAPAARRHGRGDPAGSESMEAQGMTGRAEDANASGLARTERPPAGRGAPAPRHPATASRPWKEHFPAVFEAAPDQRRPPARGASPTDSRRDSRARLTPRSRAGKGKPPSRTPPPKLRAASRSPRASTAGGKGAGDGLGQPAHPPVPSDRGVAALRGRQHLAVPGPQHPVGKADPRPPVAARRRLDPQVVVIAHRPPVAAAQFDHRQVEPGSLEVPIG